MNMTARAALAVLVADVLALRERFIGRTSTLHPADPARR